MLGGKTRGFQCGLFFVALAVLLAIASPGFAQEIRALGDLGFDPAEYQKTIKTYPPSIVALAPAAFDWRDYGVVTSAKDQGWCGSCWAFACVGVLESKILLNGGSSLDLAEQQQVSCNTAMLGCCGGSSDALTYWYSHNPFAESCTGYGDYTTSCPTYRNVPCASLSCSNLPYNTSGLFTVNTGNAEQVKTSVYDDGPAYFRFTVYSDFYTYWSSGAPGSVYTQTSGSVEGGHAVLIIGYDDAKNAWLLKNSWGATGGPNGDGTFWIARSGHAQNLSFGMTNIDLVAAAILDVDVQLNATSFVPGQQLIAKAKVTNDATADTVEVKVWEEFPDGSAVSIKNLPSYTVAANANMLVTIFQRTFTAGDPKGAYEIGARFLNRINGDILCGDIEPFTLN